MPQNPLTFHVDALPGEVRVVSLDDRGQLVDCFHEWVHKPRLVGATYIGIVRKMIASGAFVDLGRQGTSTVSIMGFLRRPREPKAHAGTGSGKNRKGTKTAWREGEVVQVQMQAAATGHGVMGKLPRLSLIEPQERGKADIKRKIPCLCEAALGHLERLFSKAAPDSLWKIAARPSTPESANVLARLEELIARDPQRKATIEIADTHLFEVEGIEDTIENLAGPQTIGGGLRVLIEETEVAQVLDLDMAQTEAHAGSGASSGRAVRLKINLGATRDVARLIRLRRLAGRILIDPAGFLNSASHGRNRYLSQLEGALNDYGVRAQVHGFTRTGLVELTREREDASLAQELWLPLGQPTPEREVFACLRSLLADRKRANPTFAGARIAELSPTARDLLRGDLVSVGRIVAERLGWENDKQFFFGNKVAQPAIR